MGLASKTCRTVAICLVTCLIGAQGLIADEPAARFVSALREKGYYDIAIEYLEKAKNNPNVAGEYRKRIQFEKATVLIEQVAQLKDRKQVDAQLDTAQRLLKEYAANNKSQVENARTLSFRSRLLSMRADVYLKEAKAEQLTEGERDKIRKQARGFLEESLESTEGALAAGKILLDPKSKRGIKEKKGDAEAAELKREIRSIYSVMVVQRPFNAERMASTFPERSPERRGLLKAAAGKYKEVTESKFANTVPGVRATLRAGLCYQQLGKHKEALDFFRQVMSRERSSVIDSLQKQAFAAAGDSWQKTKPYPARSVISQLEPVVENLSRAEKRDPQWLRVIMELGIANYTKSQEIKSEDSAKSKKVLREAGRLVRDVTRTKNPHRERARKLLEKWNVPLIESADLSEETKEIGSFADAVELGSDEMSNIELLYSELIQARNELKSDPKQTDAATVAELEKRLRDESDKTISVFNNAIALANSDSSVDEVNLCRFYQCFCYFVTGRHLEVSIVGQYLLKQHPNDAGTKSAVGLLMKSRSVAFAAAPKDDNDAELQSLKNTALEVAKRWPGSAESGGAISELIQIELRAGNMPQAVELMSRLPDDSVQRPILSAMMGQRLWSAYQVDIRDPKARSNTNQMNKKLDQALRFLKVGAETAKPDAISFSDAVTGLNLVDALLAKGETKQALQMLGSPLGPGTVLKSRSPGVFGSPKAASYKRNAYSVTIKTYLAMLAIADDQEQWLGKCNGLILLMEEEVKASGSEAAKRQLTASYYLISVELKKRFDATNDPKTRLQLAKALGEFLPSIERNSTKNGRVLLKVGSALMSMATAVSEDGAGNQSKPMFVKASKALSNAERLGFAGDKQEPQLKLELKRQSALAQRGAGQYEQAVKNFVEILKTSKSLPIQIDAASTLQQWGKSGALSVQLAQAVNGAGRYEGANGRATNAIWGWNKLMRLTQADKAKYREQYYTAAFGIAEAIYEQGKAKKKDASKTALKRIEKERTASPDFLGSEMWKEKFDGLEKRIETGG